jgi:modulator of FtsH protease
VNGYSLEGWAEFAVATAGAAGVLVSLIFIALSINLEAILAVAGLPGRAGESVVMFVGVLVLAVLMLVPQSERALAIEILVTGSVYAVGLLLIAIPGARAPGRQPLAWRATRVFGAVAAGLPAVVAGATLLAEAGGGLYWLVACFVVSFVAGIGNAWVLLVEVVRDERYRP